jgi:hypothetical protein
MAHTLVSERASQAAATPVTVPVAAGPPVAELPVADPPVAGPPRRNRLPTAHYKPETVIKKKAHSKTRVKTARVGIRGFYAVSVDDNTRSKRPRRDRMLFAYRYIVDGKEAEDYNWVTLNDMFGHPEEEQFVGCLYELLATYIGDVVNDLKTPVMQGADLLNKRYKKQ